MKKLFFALCLPLLFQACNSEPTQIENYISLETFKSEGDALFKSIEMDMSVLDVRMAEDSSNVMFDTGSTTQYKQVFGDSVELISFYHFELDALFEIQLDVTLNSTDQAESLFIELEDYYTAKYGESEFDTGYLTWLKPTDDGRVIEISIIDDSYNYGYPFISITFFKERFKI